MPIEIEKKYRLKQSEKENVVSRLQLLGARFDGDDVEENTIYKGNDLEQSKSVLRLRRVNKIAILTYKERFPSVSDIKHQREDETEVANAEAMDTILNALGFSPALVYEKRRQRWKLGQAEIVLDELPFGLFMEIEADEDEIHEVERKLGIKGLRAETDTYPKLTAKHGKHVGDVIEARFKSENE